MEPKIFTVAEANAILERTIKPAMERLGARIGAIDALKTAIEVAKLLTETGASESNPDQQHLTRLLERQKGFEADVREEIEAVHSAGGVIKDPRSGLVDFFSIVDGKLAFLCWKRGEDQIRYWHTVEEGFRGRRLLRARMPREES